MCKKLSFITAIMLVIFSVKSQDLSGYVNPFIGTANSGNTNPGVIMPWGMFSLSPFNTYDTITHTAAASPYYYGNKYIFGFTHLNMSGVGCPDMGTFNLMPVTGPLNLKELNKSVYSNEQASPGYYSVNLDRYQVRAELSAGLRSGISCYTFPKGKSHVLLNMGVGLTAKKGAVIKFVSDTEVEGSKEIGDICGLKTSGTIYFFARLSRKPLRSGLWKDGQEMAPDDHAEGDNIGAFFSFDTKANEKIYVATAVSYVSAENARKNLESEQVGFDFDKMRTAATEAWNKALSVIKLEGGLRNDKVKFYTAIYHTLLHPGIFNDANDEYRLFQKEDVRTSHTGDRYTVFSLWDTYRCLHPFLSLAYPQKQSAMVKSLLGMAKESGWLPRWEYAGIESAAMTGDPALAVIADTWLRGIHDFDINLAYEAMRHNATSQEKNNYMRPGMSDWLKYGYIPEDAPYVLYPFGGRAVKENGKDLAWQRTVWGSVSTPLEYCIADWNLAQLAKSLGKMDDYNQFYNRSMLYKNSFDTTVGFMRSRMADGSWVTPFDPVTTRNNGFTEGASWNYSFMVPHDMPGLIKLMGGPQKFISTLDTCFTKNYFDITNEPDLAYPYLYNYVKGNEWKTQKEVRKIVATDFKNSPDGLPGNDDCGTMSAWLIFSMMGFYPACPGDMAYQLSSPVFNKITIRLDPDYYPGRTFTIRKVQTSGNKYLIRSVRLNDKIHETFTINHADIISGGQLDFFLK